MGTRIATTRDGKRDPSMSDELLEIIDVMRQAHGQDAGRYDEFLLAKMVAKRMEAAACPSLAAYSGFLSQDASEARNLVD